jgi:hypothetical protein
MHLGLATLAQGLVEGRAYTDAVQAAWQVIDREVQSLARVPAFCAQSKWTLEGLDAIARRGWRAVVAGLPDDWWAGWEIVSVEEWVGNAKPDLILRAGPGLNVLDLKTTLELDATRITSRLREYDTNWQLLQNCWLARQCLGEPVTLRTVLFLVLTPKAKLYEYAIPVSSGQLDHWHETAERVAAAMQEPPYMNTTACLRYGACEFYDACHALHGDEARFDTLYHRL